MADKISFKYTKAFVAALIFGQTAQAQDLLPDAGTLLNQQQRLQPKSRQQQEEAEPIVPELKLDDVNGADKINVQRIQFQNAQNISTEAQLQQWVKNAIGKQISFAQLQQVADQVTEQLRNSGYLLARAYLPKQDVTNGTITITLLQGQLDNSEAIGIKGENLRINQLQLQDILKQNFKAAQAVHKADLERSLLLMNDLPGIKAHATLAPGQQTGTSKMTVNASEGSLLTGSVWADNFGNHYTGNWRGNGLLNINDPLHIGDQLRLSMTGSEGIILGSARYALPLMANGLNMDVHYSNLQYQIGRELTSAGLEGEATTAGTNLNYPFIRSRAFTLLGSAGYEHRALRDNSKQAQLSDRQINDAVVNLTASGIDKWFGGGINNGHIGFVAGNLDRSDNALDRITDAKNAKSQGSFAKFTYNLARLQKLNNQVSFYGSINGQQASGNLDSSEKFILGGPNGVRAYPVGEASGDHGWVINTELRWDVPYAIPIGKLQLVGFVDTGHITLHDHTYAGALSSATKKNSFQLSGGGISLNLTQNNRYQISGTWSAPIGGNPGRDFRGNNADGGRDSNRFWLQAMVWF